MSERRVIRGARLLPMDGRRQVKRQDVLLDGGVVAAVGGVSSTAGARVEETNAVLLPGLINAHVHLDQALLDRGFVPDADPWRFYGLELPAWLAKLDDGALAVSARSAIARGVRAGTVAFGDVGRTVTRQSSVDAAIALGARVVVAIDARHRDAARLLDGLQARLAPGAPVTAALWAGDAERTSSAQLRAAAILSRERGVPLIAHVGLLPGDRGGVSRLDRAGALSTRLTLVHARGHSVTDAMKALAQAGVSVVVTPSTDLVVGAPPAPVAALLEAGVNVGLGLDSGVARTDLDPFRELRLLHGMLRGRVSGPASAALEIATKGGARALGLGSGAIEVGQRADLFTIDVPLASDDHEGLARRLIDGGGPEQVRTVWIAGEPVVTEGRLVNADGPTEAEEEGVRTRRPRVGPASWAERWVARMRSVLGTDRDWHQGKLGFVEAPAVEGATPPPRTRGS